MKEEFKKQPDGTIEISITIPKKTVKQFYDQALTNLAKETEIKGFRKGKAPKDLVEKQVDKQRIYQEAVQEIVSNAYLQAVKNNDLKPIMSPRIELVSAKENQDWQIKITTCQKPTVKLGNWQEIVRTQNASAKIWLPGQDQGEADKDKPSQEEKLEKIFTALVKAAEITLPKMLVEEETTRMLSRLVDQTGKLGLTVEQYLQSVNKNEESLRAEYAAQAERTLKMEFILDQIASEEKIEVKDAAVDEMIAKIPDEETRKSFQQAEQRAYLKQLNRKQRTIDRLLAL